MAFLSYDTQHSRLRESMLDPYPLGEGGMTPQRLSGKCLYPLRSAHSLLTLLVLIDLYAIPGERSWVVFIGSTIAALFTMRVVVW
jgi:hypothetical protein